MLNTSYSHVILKFDGRYRLVPILTSNCNTTKLPIRFFLLILSSRFKQNESKGVRQQVTNICFQERTRRIWTWRRPSVEMKNQLDYITLNKRFTNAILHGKTYPNADNEDNHFPVLRKLRVNLRKFKMVLEVSKFQYDRFLNETYHEKKYMDC